MAKGKTDGNVVELETGQTYTVRKLRDDDTYVVGGMVSALLGNENFRFAAAQGNTNMMIMGAVGAMMSEIPRELRMFIADLIGYTDGLSLREVREKDQERQRQQTKERQKYQLRKERMQLEDGEVPPLIDALKSIEELEEEREEAIIERMKDLPPGASQDIITEVISRDDFVPFINSSLRLFEAAKGLSGRFGTQSSSG